MKEGNLTRKRTDTRPSVPCPSTFDPQSPDCFASVSDPYHGQAWYTSLALTQLEKVYFGTVLLLMHMHMYAKWT